jgi:hypothetical protein
MRHSEIPNLNPKMEEEDAHPYLATDLGSFGKELPSPSDGAVAGWFENPIQHYSDTSLGHVLSWWRRKKEEEEEEEEEVWEDLLGQQRGLDSSGKP